MIFRRHRIVFAFSISADFPPISDCRHFLRLYFPSLLRLFFSRLHDTDGAIPIMPMISLLL